MTTPFALLQSRLLVARLALAALVIAALARPAAAKIPACGEVDGDRAAVASAVAAADAACPCGGFAKKSEYAKCFRAEVDGAILGGSLRKQCKTTAMRAATKSTCGAKPGAVTCCKTDAKGKATCGVAASTDKCVAPRGGSAEIGVSESCFDACLPTCEDLNPSDAAVDAATAAVVSGREAMARTDLAGIADLVYAELGCRVTPSVATTARADVAGVSSLGPCQSGYCPNVNYCGPGDSETNPPLPGENPKQLGSSCMNQTCQEHDRCYHEQCISAEICMWSTQAAQCDQPFFDKCDQPCADGSISDRINKTIICSVAKLLRNVPDINPGCLGPPCADGQTCNSDSGQCETPQPSPSPTPQPSPTPEPTPTPASCEVGMPCLEGLGSCAYGGAGFFGAECGARYPEDPPMCWRRACQCRNFEGTRTWLVWASGSYNSPSCPSDCPTLWQWGDACPLPDRPVP